ncbi:hypothetical protein, partial [Aquiflexum sp.]|uniref:hypothetical protein n=1 Tax=Aquiflexum sp. TaxID=1872584 RepID=UPI00359374B1
MLPGAICGDPAFSWKYEVAPGGLGFINGSGLGSQYDGHLVLGAGSDKLEGGYLFKFKLSGNRNKVVVDDSRINDRVADNMTKHDITESESLLFGKNFGIGTDIQTGPNGNLFVVSFSHGKIYEITKN